jgi:hypothetical protein
MYKGLHPGLFPLCYDRSKSPEETEQRDYRRVIGEAPTSRQEAVMKRWGIWGLSFVFVAVLFVPATIAGPWGGWQGSGGWGKGGAYQSMFNPATVEKLSGEVVSVDQFTPMKGMNNGIHLTMKTDKETVSVHLGPAWYIERLDTQISAGDTIEVTGSRVTFQGEPAVIAATVKKGDAVLRLRDARGIPVWSGWRGRR